MEVITKVLGKVAEYQDTALQVDPIVLMSEERLNSHIRKTTKGGCDVRISLPRGSELFEDDVLAFNANVAIVVEAALEDIIIISPTTSLTWGIASFHLGNLHRTVRFTEASILTHTDPMVEDLFDRLHIKYHRCLAPFTGKNITSQGGDHHHRITHKPTHAN